MNIRHLSPDDLAGMPVQRILDETTEDPERIVASVEDVESVWPAGGAALDYLLGALSEGRITESNPILNLTLGRVVLMHVQGVLR